MFPSGLKRVESITVENNSLRDTHAMHASLLFQFIFFSPHSAYW